nr:lysine biosynthesis protein LysX [Halovenus rubra]
MCYSRLRHDEKLLLSALRERDHTVEKIDVRDLQFDISDPPSALTDVDILLDRCLATSRSTYLTEFADAYGIPIVNSAETAQTCADKVETSLALEAAGVPTPETTVAFTTDVALSAIEEFGYPCVLKPVVGSWGRLLAKVESRTAAEAVLEHKETLGHYEHSVFYIQEFVEKPGRDIRVLACDGEPLAAMSRTGDHWVTNAANGAETDALAVNSEIKSLVEQASDAVGGGLLGIDLMEVGVGDDETADGYTVHEINHTVEFKALNDTVALDVPGAVVDWLESVTTESTHSDTMTGKAVQTEGD